MAIQTYEEYVRGLSGQERIAAMEKASGAIDAIQRNSSSSRSDIARSVYQEKKDWAATTKPANEETAKSKTNPNAKTGDVQDELTVTARQRTFNINQFRSEIQEGGTLPQNRFLVIFSKPNSLSEFKGVDYLTMRCDSASIPGINFFTSQTNRYGYGQIERRPYLPTFNPITLTFIVDRASSVIGFFNQWTNSIVNYDISGGIYKPSSSGIMPYHMTYKDDYISRQMQIYVYDHFNEKQIKVTLYDAYPLSTSDTALSWTESSDVLKYSISLQYTHMKIETTEQPVITTDNSSSTGVFLTGSDFKKSDIIKDIQNIKTAPSAFALEVASITNTTPNPRLKI
jgi:hypothetical protein